jgi:hypothetical protein
VMYATHALTALSESVSKDRPSPPVTMSNPA